MAMSLVHHFTYSNTGLKKADSVEEPEPEASSQRHPQARLANTDSEAIDDQLHSATSGQRN